MKYYTVRLEHYNGDLFLQEHVQAESQAEALKMIFTFINEVTVKTCTVTQEATQ